MCEHVRDATARRRIGFEGCAFKYIHIYMYTYDTARDWSVCIASDKYHLNIDTFLCKHPYHCHVQRPHVCALSVLLLHSTCIWRHILGTDTHIRKKLNCNSM